MKILLERDDLNADEPNIRGQNRSCMLLQIGVTEWGKYYTTRTTGILIVRILPAEPGSQMQVVGVKNKQ